MCVEGDSLKTIVRSVDLVMQSTCDIC